MIRLDHADCREWLPTLADGSVDVVITDPPYSEHVHGKSRRGGGLPDAAGGRSAEISRARELGFGAMDAETMALCSREFARLSRRWVAVFCNVELASTWAAALEAAGLEYVRTGAWVKLDAAPQFTGDRPAAGFEAVVLAHPAGRKAWNGGGGQAVWTHPIAMNRGGKTPRLHTTQKPLPLMEELVSLFSDPDETILDPFAGSGTTLLAARRLGRNAIGCERDRNNYEVAHARLFGSTADQSIAGRSLPLFAAKGAP